MLDWLGDTALARYVSDHAGAQQALETVHMTAFSLVIGAVVVLDLRLAGLSRRVPVSLLARPVFRVAWLGLAVLFVGGVITALPRAEAILTRHSFQLKMALLLLAVLNLLYLQRGVRRHAGAWDLNAIPGSVRVLALVSILLWLSVVVVARFMYVVK